MRFGSGEFQFEVVPGWGTLPDDWKFSEVAAVVVDSRDRVYAYHRGGRPVIVFDRDGAVLDHWGDGWLGEAHGMYIDRDDNLFLVDRGGHTIEKCAVDGKRQLTVGEKWQPAPKWSNRPFNLPQGVAVGPGGEIFVADGKCNNAIHKFSAEGAHLKSWGRQGTGPGEFDEPHGIWVLTDGRVMVCDRSNHRIQFFTEDGDYLEEWPGIKRPDHLYVDTHGNVYVTELLDHTVSILSPTGKLLCRWGGVQSREAGLFYGPHGIWADSHGDLYVSEVLRGKRVQKFHRI